MHSLSVFTHAQVGPWAWVTLGVTDVESLHASAGQTSWAARLDVRADPVLDPGQEDEQDEDLQKALQVHKLVFVPVDSLYADKSLIVDGYKSFGFAGSID